MELCEDQQCQLPVQDTQWSTGKIHISLFSSKGHTLLASEVLQSGSRDDPHNLFL